MAAFTKLVLVILIAGYTTAFGYDAEGRKRYDLVNTNMDWETASDHCARGGGNLIAIHDAEDAFALSCFLKELTEEDLDGCFMFGTNGAYLWTAGTRLDHRYNQSSFVWKIPNAFPTDTEDPYKFFPMTYQTWQNGEPNSWLGPERCVNMFFSGKYQWNDQRCSTEMCFICEYPEEQLR